MRLAANGTLRLDDPSTTWLVETGQVLLFAVELRLGEPTGPRHLVGEFGPGDLLAGHRCGAGERLGLLATGVGSAWVRRFDLDRGLGASGPLESGLDPTTMAAALDRWLLALWGRVVAGRRPPASLVEMSPGTLTLPPGAAASPESGVLWVRAQGGSAAALGAGEGRFSTERALIPIGAPGWIVADTSLEIECVPTPEAIGRPGTLGGLALVTSALIAVLGADVERSAEARSRASRLGAARAAGESRSALLELAQILPPARQAARHLPAEDPVLAVFKAVAESAGVAIRAEDPAVGAASLTPEPSARLKALAAAVGCHLRAVDISGPWWESASGPMIGFDAEGGQVALLQRARG
ncbi:MAG: hypothetical protein ACREOV_12810, partial [Candidatus Dormibacteraceae bacterium]